MDYNKEFLFRNPLGNGIISLTSISQIKNLILPIFTIWSKGRRQNLKSGKFGNFSQSKFHTFLIFRIY